MGHKIQMDTLLTSAFADAFEDVQERLVWLKMTSDVQKIFNSVGLQNILSGTLLLGWMRNRTGNPWENDAQVMLCSKSDAQNLAEDLEMIEKVKATEKLLALGYGVAQRWGGLKVFPRKSVLIPNTGWAYPFVDVMFLGCKQGLVTM